MSASRDILAAILACPHARCSGDWCPDCGSIFTPDGEWIFPELVAAMLEGTDDTEPLHASASTRQAVERLARWGATAYLDDAVRDLSGPTCALLVVSGLARIGDGEGPRATLALTDRGQGEAQHWARVRALERPCTCGHDRGEHGTEYPGPCSECACVGFADADAVAAIAELAAEADDGVVGEPAPVVDLAAHRAQRVRP